MGRCVYCHFESSNIGVNGICPSLCGMYEEEMDQEKFHRLVIANVIGHMSASPICINYAASVLIARAIALADEATQTVFGSKPELPGISPKEK